MTDAAQRSSVLAVLEKLLPAVEEAERHLKAARNWGIADLLGGGFLIDLFKHSRLNKAAAAMETVHAHMNDLSKAMAGSESKIDFRMQIGELSTLADFLFDGIFADAYMQSKISASLGKVRELKNRLLQLKENMCAQAFLPDPEAAGGNRNGTPDG